VPGTYAYDDADRMTSAVYTKYGYDGFGRIISVIQTVGSVVLATRYGYDLAGHITSITYPSRRVLTVAYANGVPVSMSSWPRTRAAPLNRWSARSS